MIRLWVRHHPLTGFFVLAFGISWGGILIVLAARGFDLRPLQPVEGGLIFLLMLLGPSVSSLSCTALLGEKPGPPAFWHMARIWRVSVPWLAVALLTMPAILLATLWTCEAIAGPAFRPQFNAALLGVGLIAGGFEEIGWTGFATPRLLQKHSLGKSGLMLGLIWAVWHLLVDFRYNSGTMGAVWPLEFVVVYLATLTPYRILMTWVFARTKSLPLAMLMHASFTGWLLAFFPATSLAQSLSWQAVCVAALWSLVGAVLSFERAGVMKADAA